MNAAVADVTVFILAHGEWVAKAPTQPPFRVIDLEQLPVPDGVPSKAWLSEMAFFFDRRILNHDAECVWLCSGRHDKKHASRLKTRLLDLPNFTVTDPQQVWCVRRAESTFATDSDESHPGISRLIREAQETFKLRTRWRCHWPDHRAWQSDPWPTCYANSFCLHRDTLKLFLDRWHAGFAHFHEKYGINLPFSATATTPRRPGTTQHAVGLESRKGSYFYERLGMAILGDMGLKFNEVP